MCMNEFTPLKTLIYIPENLMDKLIPIGCEIMPCSVLDCNNICNAHGEKIVIKETTYFR